MPLFRDLTNQRFDRLLALSRHPAPSTRVKWLCACSCGKSVVVDSSKLCNGHTRSCGCLQIERASEASLKHGHSCYPNQGRSTKEYNTWVMMLRRCNSLDDKNFHHYGGKNITVCSRWRDFQNFLADMGLAPSKAHSIDRIDSDGNYCPENCRWATSKTQVRNRGITKMLTLNDKTLSMGEWAELYSIPYKRLHARIKRGWSVEKSITTPV